MQTPPDPPDPAGRWKPFGERVTHAVNKPADWQPMPDAAHVERQRSTGHLRTNLPLPKDAP